MKDKNRKTVLRAHIFLLLLAATISMTAATKTATAKSLYVIANLKARPTPLQAYYIGVDGSLVFQVEYGVPKYEFGAVGLAIDEDSGYLFVTYEDSDKIQLVDAITMTETFTTIAPDAYNLAGIAYDHDKGLLYCVDRATENLYVYDWEPETATLTNVTDSATLTGATAYGIALDEVNDLLYVANNSNAVKVYHTSDWSLARTISLSRIAVSVAIDVGRGFLYLGGGYVEDDDLVTRFNPYLTQYNLATDTETEVEVDPNGGVIGLGVDLDTGLVYMSTGRNNEPGGDELRVYDTALNLVDKVTNIGNPTGLVVPVKDIGYNRFNLNKSVVAGVIGETASGETKFVGIGRTVTYGIYFENKEEDLILTNVRVVDILPEEVNFDPADNNGAGGQYDPNAHTYTWSYSSLEPGETKWLELVVDVNEDTVPGTTIYNHVTIYSDETPPTTRRLDVIAYYNPLGVSKNISGAVLDNIPGVDVNEILTYTICFDNNDNDFAVTDVSIVDYLPDEVSFDPADNDGAGGEYDPDTHTYTWSYPSLEPGSVNCLDLAVRVKQDTVPGTTISNFVIADSNETPPSTASVDVITYQNPLNVSKSIIGAVDGQVKWVDASETISYRICFDNNNNENAVLNVSVVDILPDEVSFVTADSDWGGVYGRYDPNMHTYTWYYPYLMPNIATGVELVAQVNQDVAPGTTITNSVVVDSNETPPSVASVDATVNYNPLNLSKRIVVAGGGQVKRVGPGETINYGIRFDNLDNVYPVHNVSIVDKLPPEVDFYPADNVGAGGQYNPNTRTYTWLYPSMLPGTAAYLELAVRVKQGAPWHTTIRNSVTIDSDETDPLTKSVTVSTPEAPLRADKLSIVPNVLRRIFTSGDIMAVIQFPQEIQKSHLNPDDKPKLYYQDRNSGNFILIGTGRQYLSGTDAGPKVIALFNRANFMNKVPGYGDVKLKIEGKLKSGRSFYGEAIVCITRFIGG